MRLAILGSTGEIGRRALKVASTIPDCEVVAITCNTNYTLLSRQIRRFKPRFAAILNNQSLAKFRRGHTLRTTKLVENKQEILEFLSRYRVDTVISSTIGASMLDLNYALLKETRRMLLANKESIVLAGRLLTERAKRYKTQLVPLDSEHFGLYTLLNSCGRDFSRLHITASGGPFRTYTPKQLENATPAEALHHPIWKMGERITVDSATLMNKAFEIIEAKHLFGVDARLINVVIHPQSVIHAMVEYPNGSTYAQMSLPEMEIPIRQAMLDGRSNGSPVPYRLDLTKTKQLTFQEVPHNIFPTVKLGYLAAERENGYPVVLNAADEVAVEYFLKGKIRFTDIFKILEKAVHRHKPMEPSTIEDVLELDRCARVQATAIADDLIR